MRYSGWVVRKCLVLAVHESGYRRVIGLAQHAMLLSVYLLSQTAAPWAAGGISQRLVGDGIRMGFSLETNYEVRLWECSAPKLNFLGNMPWS